MKIEVTTAALDAIHQAYADFGANEEAALRVSVMPGGCSGLQYGLNIEFEIEPDDEVIQIDDLVRVVVDPFSAQYLSGIRVDWESDMLQSGFVFTNPNAMGGCGCGSSFAV